MLIVNCINKVFELCSLFAGRITLYTHKSELYVNNLKNRYYICYSFELRRIVRIAFGSRPTLSWSKATATTTAMATTTGRSIRLTATEFLANKREAPKTLTATQQSDVDGAVDVQNYRLRVSFLSLSLRLTVSLWLSLSLSSIQTVLK